MHRWGLDRWQRQRHLEDRVQVRNTVEEVQYVRHTNDLAEIYHANIPIGWEVYCILRDSYMNWHKGMYFLQRHQYFITFL